MAAKTIAIAKQGHATIDGIVNTNMVVYTQADVDSLIAAASPATISKRLATVSGISAVSAASTNLYTVPVGVTAIITKVVIICTSATSITAGAFIDIGVSAGDIIQNTQMIGLTGTGIAFIFEPIGLITLSQASTTIKATINTVAAGTSQNILIDLYGYLR